MIGSRRSSSAEGQQIQTHEHTQELNITTRQREQSPTDHTMTSPSPQDPCEHEGQQQGPWDIQDSLHALSERDTRPSESSKRHSDHVDGPNSSELPSKRTNVNAGKSTLILKFSVKECRVCGELTNSSDFVETLTSGCKHRGETCRTCLRKWISKKLDDGQWEQVSCPDCSSILQYSDMQQHADSDLFDRLVTSILVPNIIAFLLFAPDTIL
jgi:hypothetical protein